MWNPIAALKRKIKGETEAGPAGKPLDKAAAEAGLGGAAGFKELEQKGLLSKFFRHWKDPAMLKQLKAITARMQAEGVNVKDSAAVQTWLKAHEKEIESGQIASESAGAKPQTYVKKGPEIGRNDPCSCGSGKKYKKCCALKAV